MQGHIKVVFEDLENVSTLISTQGTVQVFYFTPGELHACLNLLREILVPKLGEELCLKPQGTYDLVDKIRYLIQEGGIEHDMSIDLEKLTELTGWEEEDLRGALPVIVKEIFPFGIELKISKIIAGCSRAEPYVEDWLKSVEQALRIEGFHTPPSFEWEQNQFFELARHMCTGANYEIMIRVKAFLDGRVITETEPRHLADLADGILNDILNKYQIPYETEIPVEIAKNQLVPVAIFGIAALGILAFYGLSRSFHQT